jgi:hypothetical protein
VGLNRYLALISPQILLNGCGTQINERATCIKVSGLCDLYAKDEMPARMSTSGAYRSYLKRFREGWGLVDSRYKCNIS